MARKRNEEVLEALRKLYNIAPAAERTVVYSTDDLPSEDLDDRVLIVIADKEQVVARSVQRHEADRLRASPSLALRLAEIDAAVEEARAADPALVEPGDTAELTEGEAALLRDAGFNLAKIDRAHDPGAQSQVKYARLLQSSLTCEQAGARLGVNDSRIRQRVTSDPPSLYGIKVGREWKLPRFQFGARGLVPNIDRVIAKLPRDEDLLGVYNWFHTPNADLPEDDEDERPMTPLDWLKDGRDPKRVIELAAALAHSL